MMKRLVLALCALVPATAATQQPRATFDVAEATIPQMQAALDRRTRDVARTRAALSRAHRDVRAHAQRRDCGEPDALAEADALDRERAAGHVRGPLHGIPVALKDNIHTTNMPTTGGALAFKGLVPPYEATLTKNLKDAGAIIIAKTVMTELANWVAGGPTPMPGNYSAVGGYGMNPYDPRPDPRPGFNDGRPVDGHRRFELRHRHRGEFLGRECRHGNVGLGAQPVEPEHARRHQADGRTHQPLRCHSDHGRPGHARPNGSHR